MKNYWLNRNKININEVSAGNTFQGKWYITKCKASTAYRTLWEEETTYYLHSDGKWRQSTVNEAKEYTGYFDSKEDAEKALYRI